MTAAEGTLTAGQLAVLRLYSHGQSYSDIATALGISEDAAKKRAGRAATVLGTRNVTHTVATAIRRGLLEEEPPVADGRQSERSPEDEALIERAMVVLRPAFFNHGRHGPLHARRAAEVLCDAGFLRDPEEETK